MYLTLVALILSDRVMALNLSHLETSILPDIVMALSLVKVQSCFAYKVFEYWNIIVKPHKIIEVTKALCC